MAITTLDRDRTCTERVGNEAILLPHLSDDWQKKKCKDESQQIEGPTYRQTDIPAKIKFVLLVALSVSMLSLTNLYSGFRL